MNSLTEIEISALHDALDDEYKAWSTYDQVMTEFGDVHPVKPSQRGGWS